ncbi:MAG: hypothetical protein AB8G05_11825 [Oligoflexales bacterium]
MDENIFLDDFNNWSNENNDFSFNDYIQSIFSSKQLSPDLFYAFMRLFWPEFILSNGFVFLKDPNSSEKLEKLIKGGKDVEYWANLLNVDGFFTGTQQEGEDNTIEISKRIAKSLASSWHTKLKNEYPNLKFIVKDFFDEENQEVFLTFYQVKFEKS